MVIENRVSEIYDRIIKFEFKYKMYFDMAQSYHVQGKELPTNPYELLNQMKEYVRKKEAN